MAIRLPERVQAYLDGIGDPSLALDVVSACRGDMEAASFFDINRLRK